MPSLREITKMAEYLGVSPAWLAFGVETKDVGVDEDRLQKAVSLLARTDTPKEKYGERIRWIYNQLDDATASELIEELLRTRK